MLDIVIFDPPFAIVERLLVGLRGPRVQIRIHFLDQLFVDLDILDTSRQVAVMEERLAPSQPPATLALLLRLRPRKLVERLVDLLLMSSLILSCTIFQQIGLFRGQRLRLILRLRLKAKALIEYFVVQLDINRTMPRIGAVPLSGRSRPLRARLGRNSFLGRVSADNRFGGTGIQKALV